MVNIKRPYNKEVKAAIAKLRLEKTKKNGQYLLPEVIAVAKKTFHGKCYLCGFDKATEINIEHFKPHFQGKYKVRKFSWSNLFWCCSHCNSIKSIAYNTNEFNHILDCTDRNNLVEDWLSYRMNPFLPQGKVYVSVEIDKNLLPDDETRRMANNTVKLLEKIYNGHTLMKIEGAINLREHLFNELNDFRDTLIEYHKKLAFPSEKKRLLGELKLELDRKKPFTAFKKWMIRDSDYYYKELKTNLNPKDFKNIFE